MILDNNISINTLKKQFFNKILKFKNSNDLLVSLKEFKNNNISWTKSFYLNKIKDNNLNVDIYEYNLDNTLLLEVKDYNACQTLGPQAWCIVYSEEYFNDYKIELNRQYIYIYFNFNIGIEK